MDTIVILGAGELGATLAYRLAAREICRRVVLVDPDLGKAQGKALDILQAGPIGGFDTRVEAAADAAAAGTAEVFVVGDPPEPDPSAAAGAHAFVRALLPALGRGVLLAAGPHPHALVEAAVRAGVPRSRALGSAPTAYAAALRRSLGVELGASARRIELAVLGWPPGHLVVPQGSATLGGVPVERISATATSRAIAAVRRRVPGPLALAAAATRVLTALAGPRGPVLSVVACLDGEYGHRGVALAAPALLGSGRLASVLEFPLDPVNRVALDSAAQARQEAG